MKGSFALNTAVWVFCSTDIGRCTHSLGDWLSEWEQQKDQIQSNPAACLPSWCCDAACLGGAARGAGFVQFILSDQHHLPRKFPNQRASGGAGLKYLSEQRDTAKCTPRFKQNLCFQDVLPLLGSVWSWAEQVHHPQTGMCLSLENWTMQSCQQEIISTQHHPAEIHPCSAYTVCFLFEEHKKGCKNSSLHSPCWLTVGKHAPSILLNHRALGRFIIFGDTVFFLHDKALCYQSLPAWACNPSLCI